MLIDSSSRRNLELGKLSVKSRKGLSSLGAGQDQNRYGRQNPRSSGAASINAQEIERRLEAVEELNQQPMLRDELREYLQPILIWSVSSAASATNPPIPGIWYPLHPLWK